MKFLILTSFILSLMVFSPPQFAQAQAPCDDRAKIISRLAKKYKETPIAVGLSARGLVEVLSTKDGKTWTIIVTSPNGYSCLVTAGTDWQIKKPTSLDPGA